MRDVLPIVLLSGLSACADKMADGEFRVRAAFDLGCNQKSIRVVEFDDSTRGVEGCGQRATYVYQCGSSFNGFSTDCTWVMNAASRTTTQPPATNQPPPVRTTPAPSASAPPPVGL